MTHPTREREPRAAAVLDNRGMLCAQGILQLMRCLLDLPALSVVKVISSDPAAEHDYPAWCARTGHRFLGDARENDEQWGTCIVSWVQKRPDEEHPP